MPRANHAHDHDTLFPVRLVIAMVFGCLGFLNPVLCSVAPRTPTPTRTAPTKSASCWPRRAWRACPSRVTNARSTAMFHRRYFYDVCRSGPSLFWRSKGIEYALNLWSAESSTDILDVIVTFRIIDHVADALVAEVIFSRSCGVKRSCFLLMAPQPK